MRCVALGRQCIGSSYYPLVQDAEKIIEEFNLGMNILGGDIAIIAAIEDFFSTSKYMSSKWFEYDVGLE